MGNVVLRPGLCSAVCGSKIILETAIRSSMTTLSSLNSFMSRHILTIGFVWLALYVTFFVIPITLLLVRFRRNIKHPAIQSRRPTVTLVQTGFLFAFSGLPVLKFWTIWTTVPLLMFYVPAFLTINWFLNEDTAPFIFQPKYLRMVSIVNDLFYYSFVRWQSFVRFLSSVVLLFVFIQPLSGDYSYRSLSGFFTCCVGDAFLMIRWDWFGFLLALWARTHPAVLRLRTAIFFVIQIAYTCPSFWKGGLSWVRTHKARFGDGMMLLGRSFKTVYFLSHY